MEVDFHGVIVVCGLVAGNFTTVGFLHVVKWFIIYLSFLFLYSWPGNWFKVLLTTFIKF